MIVTNIIIYC